MATEKDSATIWVVVSNTDLTEGKGMPVYLHHCWCEATAHRLSHKKGVMGSDARVEKMVAYKIGNQWFVPCNISHPSKEDEGTQKSVDACREAIKKAKDAGLNDDEIKAISQGLPFS